MSRLRWFPRSVFVVVVPGAFRNGFAMHLKDSEGKNSHPCFLSDIKLELVLVNILMHSYAICNNLHICTLFLMDF